MNIGIIGLGYVGLTLAVCAASKGLEVYGVETSRHIKNCLGENHAHFYEPGLDNLIRRHNNKNLHVVETFPKETEFEAFVITVGTPLKDGEKQPNFDYIRSALRGTLQDVYDGSQLIILRSTVSVGTTRKIVLPFLAELCGKPEDEILVAMCPERTLEGVAVHELTHLPQIISGNNKQSLEIAHNVFRYITPYIIEADSLEEAELIKLYCNTYRDMTFSIGNAFCVAAQNFNVDGIRVIQHANEGYSRSNIAYPGFVAGPCLEKDAYILINNMPECDSKNFILAARKFNESLEDIVVKWVEDYIGKPEDEVIIALSGMAFKGKPETSDLRGSSSVYIARKLAAKGYRLHIHDFVALPEEMNALEVGTVFGDIYDACQDASALLVLNNHPKYSSLVEHPNLYKHKNKNGFKILDSWRVCSELYYSDGVDVRTLGNMMCSQSEEDE